MNRIEQMYAFIVEYEPGKEGLAAIIKDGNWEQLTGSNMDHIKVHRAVAEQIARESGRRVKLVHFTNRIDIEVIEAVPNKSPKSVKPK